MSNRQQITKYGTIAILVGAATTALIKLAHARHVKPPRLFHTPTTKPHPTFVHPTANATPAPEPPVAVQATISEPTPVSSPPPVYLTANEAAQKLGISPAAFRAKAKRLNWSRQKNEHNLWVYAAAEILA